MHRPGRVSDGGGVKVYRRQRLCQQQRRRRRREGRLRGRCLDSDNRPAARTSRAYAHTLACFIFMTIIKAG
jgi:hypothetical protein